MDFADRMEGDRVRMRDILDVLGDRAYGLLLLILAFPNVIPNPIPGLSGLLGMPLILVAAQLVLGRPYPWFPAFVADRSLATADFRRVVHKAAPALQKLERLLRPRLRWVCTRRSERLLAVFCLALAILLALPIPLGNIPPALAISLIALGLVEHDGLAIGAGVVIGVIGAAIASTVLVALAGAAMFFIQSLF